MCDPHARLIRLVSEQAGPASALLSASATPWTSVTFSGMRHCLSVLADAGGAARLQAISAESLSIPGHLLADLAVGCPHPAGTGWTVDLAALTLERA